MERLEDRAVPAATATLSNGVLTILGSAGADSIHLTQSGGNLLLTTTGQAFALSQVQQIAIDSGDGDDTIALDASVTLPAWIYAGSGNDSVRGGSGANNIYGASGNDTLIGGPSNDEIYGGAGTDNVTGGGGTDVATDASPFLSANIDSFAQRVVDLTNAERAKFGLSPLSVSPQLVAAATIHANNMVRLSSVYGLNGAMSHTLMGNTTPTVTSRANTVGYDYAAFGENIAYGYNTPEDVVAAWMNSPGHRANILNSLFTQIGVSWGRTAGGTIYFAQEFGTPLSGGGGGGTPPPPPPPTLPPPPAAPSLPAPVTGFGGTGAKAGQFYVVGADAGQAPVVQVFDAVTGSSKFVFFAYDPAFRGGVRVAAGDVNGDGVDDIVTAAGAGGGPHVRIFDGQTGKEMGGFFAYNMGFTGGVNLAVGDVNGDGAADIVTGADAGGGPHVRVFDGKSLREFRGFFAYNPAFAGGVRVAVGDVNGDGKADIITGAGPGGGPHVRVFNGQSLQEIAGFFAYNSGFRGGVNVAAGDVNGDGKLDIITGAGVGGGPHVRVFDALSRNEVAGFFAFDAAMSGGVRLSTLDFDGDGRSEILVTCGNGPGSKPQVRMFSGSGALFAEFLAGDPSNVGGAYIG